MKVKVVADSASLTHRAFSVPSRFVRLSPSSLPRESQFETSETRFNQTASVKRNVHKFGVAISEYRTP